MAAATPDETFGEVLIFDDVVHNCKMSFVQSEHHLVRYHDLQTILGRTRHLLIARRDGKPIHEWHTLQRIKNTLVGPEFEAVELYPAQSRLIDTGNVYHLWVFLDQPIPFGYTVEKGYEGQKL